MKANLIFDLPDEKLELEVATNGAPLYSALNNLKQKIEFQLSRELVPNQKKQVLAEINNMLIDELKANNINHLF